MSDDPREAFSVSRVVPVEDLAWLLQSAIESEKRHDSSAAKFAHLAGPKYKFEDTAAFDTIYAAAQESKLIAAEFAWLLRPVDLTSEAAKESKRLDELIQWKPPRTLQPDPPVAVRVENCLLRAEGGDADSFWQLNYWLQIDSHNRTTSELEPDLMKSPGWLEASSQTRDRIVRVAETYLKRGSPGGDEWLREKTVQRSAFAGYRALRLLKTQRPAVCDHLGTAVWRRWASVVVGYPTVNEELDLQRDLVAMAYKSAPDDVLQSLDALVDSDLRSKGAGDLRFSLSKVDACWLSDNKLSRRLLTRLFAPDLRPEPMGVILAELLRHNVPEAYDFAREQVKLPIPTDEERRKRAISVARELLGASRQAGLEILWPVLEADEAFGKEAFLDFAQQPIMGAQAFFSNLNDKQLANIFIWLEKQFPRESDPDHGDEAYFMGPRDSVAQFRDEALHSLVGRGTTEAVEHLRRARDSLPHLKWMYVHVLNAEAHMMRSTWTPPRPDEVLALARDSKLRLVSSARELVEVVIESLKRLQDTDLKGQTPRAPFLWDPTSRGAYKPKGEPWVSNYVKAFLERDSRNPRHCSESRGRSSRARGPRKDRHPR